MAAASSRSTSRAERGIGLVAGREPSALRLGHAESRCPPCRAARRSAAARKSSNGRAGGARDQHGEDVEARVIQPPLARLMDQRQAGRSDRISSSGASGGGFGPGSMPASLHRPLDRPVARRLDDQAEAHAHGQQVAQRDRAVRRHGVVERPVEPRSGPCGRRAPASSRSTGSSSRELAFLDQNHRGCRGDRLGHRGDAEDRIAPHRVAAGDDLHADRIDMHFAAPAHHGDDAGCCAALDTLGQDVVHALEPRPGQAAPNRHSFALRHRRVEERRDHRGEPVGAIDERDVRGSGQHRELGPRQAAEIAPAPRRRAA